MTGDLARWNIEFTGLAELSRIQDLVRYLSLGKQHHAEVRTVDHFFTDRVVVETEPNTRICLKHLSGTFWIFVSILTNSVFVQEKVIRTIVDRCIRVRHGVGQSEVHDTKVTGLRLDRFDIPIIRDTRLNDIIAPPVAGFRRNGVWR